MYSSLKEKVFSEKVKVLSFIAMIGVLLIHSQIPCKDGTKVKMIQDVFVNISRFGVPFFFMISGYFYFKSQKEYKDKIKNRVKSLFIPYVLWCIFFIIMVSGAASFQNLNNDYLKFLHEGKLLEFIRYIFLRPAAFHLWYIRDLMILVVVSPLIGCAIKYHSKITLIACIVVSVLFWEINYIPYGIFFYTLGSYYACNNNDLFENIPSIWGGVFFVIALFIMMISPLFGYNVMNYSLTELTVSLMFIIGIWKLYDMINWNKTLYYKTMLVSDCTFFIYCAHIPTLMVIKRCIYPNLINNSLGILLSFFVSPCVCVLILLALSIFAKKYIPNIYYITTGGR